MRFRQVPALLAAANAEAAMPRAEARFRKR